jgi:hypothetical protein
MELNSVSLGFLGVSFFFFFFIDSSFVSLGPLDKQVFFLQFSCLKGPMQIVKREPSWLSFVLSRLRNALLVINTVSSHLTQTCQPCILTIHLHILLTYVEIVTWRCHLNRTSLIYTWWSIELPYFKISTVDLISCAWPWNVKMLFRSKETQSRSIKITQFSNSDCSFFCMKF